MEGLREAEAEGELQNDTTEEKGEAAAGPIDKQLTKKGEPKDGEKEKQDNNNKNNNNEAEKGTETNKKDTKKKGKATKKAKRSGRKPNGRFDSHLQLNLAKGFFDVDQLSILPIGDIQPTDTYRSFSF